MEKYTIVLLSGGIGSRMQNHIPKQHILLSGKPIIMHSIEQIDRIEDVNQVVITCPNQYVEELKIMMSNYNLNKKYDIIDGGNTRQESVYLALKLVSNENVILHESARPFVKVKEFENLIDKKDINVTYGIDIPFTVLKKNNNLINGVLERKDLVNIQLPQKFSLVKLKKAHNNAIKNNRTYTEDVSLMFNELNEKTIIIKGSPMNIKITNPIDFKLAEIIYEEIYSL